MWKNDSTSTIVVMHRMDITASNHPEAGVYLRRWYIFRCPLGGVMLHKIMREDLDRELHDHPWAFFSIVLRGGYVQEEFANTRGDVRFRRIETANWMPHGVAHRIAWLLRHPTWTLVFTGPKRSSWGFFTADGWVPWREWTARDADSA